MRRVSVRITAPLLVVLGLVFGVGATPAAARDLVSVQPVVGPGGPQVRATVLRLVRRKGYRVTTGVPRATGTGQYYTWAREAGLTAFVASELVPLGRSGRRQRLTFLVWSGHDGSVVGRWTVTAHARALPRAVARGFWRHLGRALARAEPPAEWRQMSPGPTLRIDASASHDGAISGKTAGVYAGRRSRTR
jgi:hypothetical protein